MTELTDSPFNHLEKTDHTQMITDIESIDKENP